ncbi:hypothetical protein [Photorhabdus heterorhabditis]|uniref:Uncharacterized protein n=1 Tax=Photorhabdus heterorhabditis TaxID=880156 RepID=A0A5B0W1E0_9GAMM|nr:hypothetical protein [Photorhabdus heterorhabditis]KAA1179759.1 hypothetical protein F0L16_17895 [Photorhabdus heterorhabditis]KOY60548.1 hypothetical protein AM629_18740 [Photorhabdus heterorhabditis]
MRRLRLSGNTHGTGEDINTPAQAAWIASSVGKIVNNVNNDVAKKHIGKNEMTHNARTDLLTRIKQINKENR